MLRREFLAASSLWFLPSVHAKPRMSVYNLDAPAIPKPVKYAGNPIMIGGDVIWERPWNRIQLSGSVVKRPSLPWQMFYLQQYAENPPGNALYWLCYAEASEPFGPWRKPVIRVMDGWACNALMKDDQIGFQGLGVYWDEFSKSYRGAGGHIRAESSNGAEWPTIYRNWYTGNDTNTSLLKFAPFAQVQGGRLFNAFVREQGTWTPGGGAPTTLRRIALADAADWNEWSAKMPITQFDAPGDDDNKWEQPYALAATSYGEYVVGLLWWLHLEPLQGNNMVGYTDCELVWCKPPAGSSSLRGLTWRRTYQPFLRVGLPGSYDAGAAGPAPLVFEGDTVYCFYTSAKNKHGVPPAQLSISVATMPKTEFDTILQ